MEENGDNEITLLSALLISVKKKRKKSFKTPFYLVYINYLVGGEWVMSVAATADTILPIYSIWYTFKAILICNYVNFELHTTF